MAAGTVVALGEASLVEGYRLVGASVRAVEDPTSVLDAWQSLPPGTALVVLTPRAAGVLATQVLAPDAPLTVVMPS